MTALSDNLGTRLKGAFPFALGTTSYIVPADVLPNTEVLAPLVDDIELVLFESPDVSNLPSREVITQLKKLADTHATGFTIHFPGDRRAGAQDAAERQRFLDAARRIVELCAPLTPRAWVLHLEGIAPNADEATVAQWTHRCEPVAAGIAAATGDPAAVVVENLGYPWHWHRDLVERLGLSLCCDIGHLWKNCPYTWATAVREMLPRTRVIHLHGLRADKDHVSLAKGDKNQQEAFLRMLAEAHYDGVLTLEIFNEADLSESVEVVWNLWERLHS